MEAVHGLHIKSNATESRRVSLFDWADIVGRIALASLFLWSGYDMFAHMASQVALMQAYGMPAANLLIWPAGLLELVAAAMLVLGWKARWAALALIVFTVASTFIFHAYWSVPSDQVWDQLNNFMKNLAIVGGLLVVLAHGCGPYALDKS